MSVCLFIYWQLLLLFRNDDGGIKLSSDELSSDEDDDSLINENRQLFRPGPNGMSDDDLSEGIFKNHNLSLDPKNHQNLFSEIWLYN